MGFIHASSSRTRRGPLRGASVDTMSADFAMPPIHGGHTGCAGFSSWLRPCGRARGGGGGGVCSACCRAMPGCVRLPRQTAVLGLAYLLSESTQPSQAPE
jgi:hypothetical protein